MSGEDEGYLLLSEHVRRHHSVSVERLREYVSKICVDCKEGSTITKLGSVFITDFARTMVELYEERRAELKQERAELARLRKIHAKSEAAQAFGGISPRPPSGEGNLSEEEDLPPLPPKLGLGKLGMPGTPRQQLLHFEQAGTTSGIVRGVGQPPVGAPHSAIAHRDGNVQRVDLSKLVKKPRYFDGITPMPREWIEEYLDAVEDNCWDESTAVYYFKHFLVKDASNWFKLAVRPMLTSQSTMSDVYKEFEANFLGRAEQDRLRLVLRNTRMGPDERVATFIPKVLHILLMLSPLMHEEEKVAQVSEKLKSQYAAAIVDKDPRTIAELRDVCRKVEAAADLRRAAPDYVNPRAVRARSQVDGPSNAKQEAVRSTTRKEDFKCFRCGRNNHLVKDCTATRHFNGEVLEDRPRAKPKEKTLAVFDEDIESEEEVTAEIEDDPQSNEESVEAESINMAVDSIRAATLPKLTLNCNNQEFAALVDTAASRTVIDEKIPLKYGWPIEQCGVSLLGANKTSLEIVGRCMVTIQLRLGNVVKKKNHKVIVIRNLAARMLFGADLIREFKLEINLSKDSYKFSDYRMPELVNTVKPAETITKVELPNSSETVKIGDQLSETQRLELADLIKSHAQAFSLRGEIGTFSRGSHSIDLSPEAKAVVEPLRRRAPSHDAEIQKQVRHMLDEDIIEPSRSPWASAIVLVKKKGGDMRMCVDYRKLNDQTKKNAFPLPNIQTCLDNLAGNSFFSTFDFASGYLQIPMEESSKEYTAFRTNKGHYQFKRMPFGLCTAPSTFQQIMNEVLLRGNIEAQCYLDDVCLASQSWPKHLEQLDKFFKVVRDEGLKLKATKCQVGMKQVLFLGHKVSCDGVAQDPNKLRAIGDMDPPKDASGVRRVMGCFSYYRRFVPRFSEIADPLITLTKKNASFTWGDAQQRAFETLKKELLSASVLALFNNTDEVKLKTDASVKGVAGMLFQNQNSEWRLIACCSRRLTKNEMNYGPTDLEGLAVVFATKKFRPYLLGRHWILATDHCSLCVLKSRMPSSPRLRRWAILLSEFDFTVVYTRGSQHLDVDCLSRAPVEEDDDEFEERVLYICAPVDTDGWAAEYSDEESRKLMESAEKNGSDIRVVDGLIFKGDKLYVPKAKRVEIFNAAHQSATGGHGGVLVTMNKISDCWWPEMESDIELWVRTCERCQLRKADRRGKQGLMNSFQTCAPMQVLSVDTLGPMTLSIDSNRYVIVAQDVFTRFVNAKAIANVTAAEAKEFLLELFSRFGPPQQVITDRGSQFANVIIKDMLAEFNVDYRLATPDHAPSNAPAERTIETLQEKLAISEPEVTLWDRALPKVVLAMNTSINATTKFTPFEMMFGRQVKRVEGPTLSISTPEQVHQELLSMKMKNMSSSANANQEKQQRRAKERYDMNRRPTEFNIGDEVLVKIPDRRRGKLSMRFKGPYEILARNGDIYEVQDANRRVVTRHVSSLKEFNQARNLNAAAIVSMLLLALQLFGWCAAERSPPVIWRRNRDVVVYGNTELFDLTIGFKSPCSALAQAATKFNRTQTVIVHKNESLPDPHIAMVAKCNGLYEEEWVSSIASVTAKCQERAGPADVAWPDDTSVASIPEGSWGNLQKRGLITSVIAGAAGGFIGIGVSDLVGLIWDQFYPYSDHNRLGRTEKQIEEVTTRQGKLLNAFQNCTKGIAESLTTITNDIEASKNALRQILSDIPEFIFGSLRIYDYIKSGAKAMNSVADECEKSRQVDTKALTSLIKHPALKAIVGGKVSMHSVAAVGASSNSLRFRFAHIDGSKSTKLFAVDPFDHWSDVGETELALLHYEGPQHVLLNEKIGCSKGVDLAPGVSTLYETCDTPGYKDPRLSLWKEIDKKKYGDIKPTMQMKTDNHHNYILCFPGKIYYNKVWQDCTLDVLRLGVWVPFEVEGFTKYQPKLFRESFTLQDLDFHISFSHVSGPTDGSSTALMKEVLMLRELAKSINETGYAHDYIHDVKISAKMLWLGAFLVLLVILTVVGLIYCCFCKRNQTTINTNIEMTDAPSSLRGRLATP